MTDILYIAAALFSINPVVDKKSKIPYAFAISCWFVPASLSVKNEKVYFQIAEAHISASGLVLVKCQYFFEIYLDIFSKFNVTCYLYKTSGNKHKKPNAIAAALG